uniref:Hydroxymethylglutaryl-coenzyme A synthase C-terminal domain-containing protein n=1 Tax=Zooxanthella nutricula TaxID=1333877 RepID=A0A7S2NRK3_9DINO
MGGPNRQRNVGVHTIEIYHPQFYIKQIEMEEWDSRPDRYGPSVIGKYTKGIGMIEGRFPTDDEDPVSFSMTVTHRLIDRMQRVGFNMTGQYAPDGQTINAWNAFGRLDIGSESLIDRSKSMKSYVMDLFERYGDEANVEGVDMYNACYGGQAAGLAVVNWVESDRWDGRYGLAIATDISEAHSAAFFTVGAACTGTLFFPEAPVAHHSHRSSAILHRLDFFKPVGWKSMAPLVDGKYSIDAYMTCIELCYATLRKKLNDRPVFQVSDYNVFHTGGGYHVVKKAFERMCRADDPNSSYEQKQQLVQDRLIPSVHLLKIIGPCHTVSSFLNMSSVIMSQWEKALGKVLIVFTYGSGCAASMYQLRFDDLAWMEPLNAWKVGFYRNAIHMPPWTQIHDVYIDTWMKFDYKPHGREAFSIDPFKYELDAYYLMEIDKWGRRFYHRGGAIAPDLDKQYRLRADQAEGRPKRNTWRYVKNKPAPKEKVLEDEWKQAEYDMVYDPADYEEEQLVDERMAKTNPNHKIVTVEIASTRPAIDAVDHDAQPHTYQIVGSWSNYKEAEDMYEEDGLFQYTVTVGENGWEDFYLLQDNQEDKKIFPAAERSWKALPCVGPHRGGDKLKKWRIDARDVDGNIEEDIGRPGDQYLVVFQWKPGSLKNLEWDKLEGERGDFRRGAYHIAGSWNC